MIFSRYFFWCNYMIISVSSACYFVFVGHRCEMTGMSNFPIYNHIEAYHKKIKCDCKKQSMIGKKFFLSQKSNIHKYLQI